MKEEQDTLNLKIKQLQDDEYIAKLLRKEYYLSEKGEIIFIIPDKEDKKTTEKLCIVDTLLLLYIMKREAYCSKSLIKLITWLKRVA